MHDVRGGDQVGCIACALRAGWASPAGHASVRRLPPPPPPPPAALTNEKVGWLEVAVQDGGLAGVQVEHAARDAAAAAGRRRTSHTAEHALGPGPPPPPLPATPAHDGQQLLWVQAVAGALVDEQVQGAAGAQLHDQVHAGAARAEPAQAHCGVGGWVGRREREGGGGGSGACCC